MSQKYRFVPNLTNDNKQQYQPKQKFKKIHQICMFQDPDNGKYKVRTVYFDSNYDIVKVTSSQYTPEQCKELITKSKINEYKTYPTYDLDLIDYPNSDDLVKVDSGLLDSNMTMNYNGYAAFDE